MGPLGVQEMVALFVIALVLFGPKKLPELAKTLGKAVSEFRRASNELKATFDREMQSLERENESLKEVTQQYQYDNYNYDYSSYDSSYEAGSYTTENYDSTVSNPSTEGASAIQGAESTTADAPEGTVAHGTEMAASDHGTPAVAVTEPKVAKEPASAPAEHKA